MKVIHSSETNAFKNSDVCIAYEYPFQDSDINIATIKLSGRYPTQGRVVNTKCKEMCLITEGEGKVVIEDKEFLLKKGDCVFIEVGEKYYWDGTLTMCTPCTPAWYPEQHEEVD